MNESVNESGVILVRINWVEKVLRMIFLLLILVIISPEMTSCNDEGTLDVAAFNVQSFGRKKVSNENIRNYLVKIVLRYDLILIQEIKDVTGKAIQLLLKEVQAADPRYKLKISKRLGSRSYKEQYAYIYRHDWLNVIDEFTFDDVDDIFVREPYIIRFHSSRASVNDFAVGAIHTTPRNAESEISDLVNVYDDIVQKWGTRNVVFMGDFNAGCSYVKDWEDIELATDRRFYWLIDNKADTTTKRSDCPYDRIVISGKNLLEDVVPLSPRVYNFGEEYKLSYDETVKISDHYPVEFKIKSLAEKQNIIDSTTLNLLDGTNKRPGISELQQLTRKAERQGYKTSTSYSKSGKLKEVGILFEVNGNIVKCLTDNLRQIHVFPGYVTDTQIFAASRKLTETDILRFLPRGYGLFQTLYDFYKNKQIRRYAQFKCKLFKNDSFCEIQIN